MALLLLLSLAVPGGLPMAKARELAYAPVSGAVTSNFGWRTDPMNGSRRFHGGVDIGAPNGMPVYAPQNAVVVYSGYYGGYGNCVVLHHGSGLYTLYGHASKRLVNVGDAVNRGTPIALVGSTGRSTGPHLHFEVHYNKQYVDPMAYLSYLQKANPGLKQASPHQMGDSAPGQASAAKATTVSYAGGRRSSKYKGRAVQIVNGTDVQTVRF